MAVYIILIIVQKNILLPKAYYIHVGPYLNIDYTFHF